MNVWTLLDIEKVDSVMIGQVADPMNLIATVYPIAESKAGAQWLLLESVLCGKMDTFLCRWWLRIQARKGYTYDVVKLLAADLESSH